MTDGSPVHLPVWVRGALICLFGSTLTALGIVLQKFSHAADAAAAAAAAANPGNAPNGATYCSRPWWLLGFSIFVAAQLINMVSMAMAPQAVLSCLGSWTLVCNTFFARLILKESVSRMQVVAVCGLVVGTAAVICNAPRPSSNEAGIGMRIDFLARRFVSPEFCVLSAFLLSFAALTRVCAFGLRSTLFCCWAPGDAGDTSPAGCANRIAAKRSSVEDVFLQPTGRLSDVGSGTQQTPTAAAVAVAVQSVQGRPSSPTSLTRLRSPSAAAARAAARKAADVARRSMAPFSWATAAAISAGYTALLFKCVAEMLASAPADLTQQDSSRPPVQPLWFHWQTYAIACAALSVAPAELHYLNLALQSGEALFVVPTYLALGMLAQLSTGIVFFEEFKDFSSRRHALSFAASVGLTLTFVVLMAKAQGDKAEAEALNVVSEADLDFKRPSMLGTLPGSAGLEAGGALPPLQEELLPQDGDVEDPADPVPLLSKPPKGRGPRRSSGMSENGPLQRPLLAEHAVAGTTSPAPPPPDTVAYTGPLRPPAATMAMPWTPTRPFTPTRYGFLSFAENADDQPWPRVSISGYGGAIEILEAPLRASVVAGRGRELGRATAAMRAGSAPF
eukprot:TRINITY_DN32890_c0_g1_i2.p1 TRINITY_DN32890_c0_g1~~TRINITY_DN32890_c0_g1_i2.p1  ORF type:complete len:619 (+),score=135.49 TRINITY_DN32890_c0_g1_i2:111-1967(+)